MGLVSHRNNSRLRYGPKLAGDQEETAVSVAIRTRRSEREARLIGEPRTQGPGQRRLALLAHFGDLFVSLVVTGG